MKTATIRTSVHKPEAEKKLIRVSNEKLKSLENKVKPTNHKVEADKATKAAMVKKITDKKDLIYIYPEDCTDLPSRKAFRHKVRRTLEAMNKKLKRIEKGKVEGDGVKYSKEIEAYKKQILVHHS